MWQHVSLGGTYQVFPTRHQNHEDVQLCNSCLVFLFVCAVLRSLGYIHCQALATATTTSSGVNGSVSTTSAFAAKHLH